VIHINDKKAGTRFSIQFNRGNPEHRQVADIINRHKRYDKAQYIVSAVLHYENCGEIPDIQRTAPVDEKYIEAVVNRILRDKSLVGTNTSDAFVCVPQADINTIPAEEIDFDEAIEALGENAFNAIAGALDMFRKK
jgi:hypothetical protein